MSSVPVRGTITQARSKTFDEAEQTNNFDEALKLLEQLFEARLIDRISKPIDKKVKEEYIHVYQVKLNQLHDRLKRIAKEASQKWQKKTKGKHDAQQKEQNKFIRSIQSKYCEVGELLWQVVLEGSFKHLNKICRLLDLRYDSSRLGPVNIQQWANACLHSNSDVSCC